MHTLRDDGFKRTLMAQSIHEALVNPDLRVDPAKLKQEMLIQEIKEWNRLVDEKKGVKHHE